MRNRQQYQANQPATQPILLMQREPAKKTTNLETEVYIPVFHALIITGAWTLPTLLIAGALLWLTHLAWYYILAALVIPALVFPITISRYIAEQRGLLWKVEEYEQPNGEPPRPPSLRVEVQRRDATGQLRGIDNLDFGVEEAKALRFIREVLAGAPITEAYWTGRGRPFSKREYNPLRDMLIARGLLQWRNPTAPAQGVELTTHGRQVFEQITQQEP